MRNEPYFSIMRKQTKNQIYLHLLIVLLGFTGILGKLISLDAAPLVWFRMLIALFGLLFYLIIRRISLVLSPMVILKILATGLITAAHWITFFMSIKVANVSVALICFASTTFFMALLEPLFFKRKILLYELLLGLVVIFGLYFIFELETGHQLGIVFGVLAAFLGSLFMVINGIYIKKYDAVVISTYEMIGGFLGLSLFMFLSGDLNLSMLEISIIDFAYLLILGLICTSFAFVVNVFILRELPPFSVSISFNLEPIYAIIFALIILGSTEVMKPGFYLGSLIILSSIILNGYLKNRKV